MPPDIGVKIDLVFPGVIPEQGGGDVWLLTRSSGNMADPGLVADCYRAMRDAVDIGVTVKSRIGIDDKDSYEFLDSFVSTLAAAGCRKFIVHARIALLSGLSPKQNRSVPPLKYDRVYRRQRRLRYDAIRKGHGS